MASSYIKKRRQGFYFQRAVPLDLRATWGKSVVCETLKTRDPHAARIAALELHQQYEAAFERVRETGQPLEGHPSGLDGRGLNWLTGKPGKADPKYGLSLRFSQAADAYLADLERDPPRLPRPH